MASAASSSADAQIVDLKTRLYDFCREEEQDQSDIVFRQEDLLASGVIPGNDVSLLLQVAQRLVNEKLFKLVQDGSIGWMYRPADEAAKYRNLTYEQEMVYALIDEAGSEGIWSKTIKSKTQMHDTTMRLALKNLETKRLITDMKTVEHPTRKMYIKTSIRPSDRATGGPWYTDGEMDEDFIEALATVLVNYIKSRSFYRSSRAQKAPKRGTSAAEVKAMRNAALGPTIKSENGISSKPPAANRTSTSTSTTTLLPMPPGYQSYPTLDDCTKFIANSNLTSTPLAQDDIQQLLDMLVYDQRIEKILSGSEGVAYKMSRRAAVLEEFGIENPLVQAPCGRCPVFELCEEGGPVGPSNCEYFREWLNA